MLANDLDVWAELVPFCCYQLIVLVLYYSKFVWDGHVAERKPSDSHMGKPSYKANVCNTDPFNIWKWKWPCRSSNPISLMYIWVNWVTENKCDLLKISQCVSDIGRSRLQLSFAFCARKYANFQLVDTTMTFQLRSKTHSWYLLIIITSNWLTCLIGKEMAQELTQT